MPMPMRPAILVNRPAMLPPPWELIRDTLHCEWRGNSSQVVLKSGLVRIEVNHDTSNVASEPSAFWLPSPSNQHGG